MFNKKEKEMTSKHLKAIMPLLLMVVILMTSSCDKSEEAIPDYIGTWTTTESTMVDGIQVSLKSTLTLSEGKYNESLQIVAGPGMYVDFMKFFCDMAVNQNKMNITIKRIGLIEIINDQPTGKMNYYDEKDDLFMDLLNDSDFENPFEIEYNVNGNTLTTRYDSNKNGQFESGETTQYTRE